jgi:hypothetical protein
MLAVADVPAAVVRARVIPTLPGEIDGVAVAWGEWELAPWMTHVENGCDICDHEGPLSTALGRAVDQPMSFHASRCRRCQTTRVMTRRPGFITVNPGTNEPNGTTGGYEYVWQHIGTETGEDL